MLFSKLFVSLIIILVSYQSASADCFDDWDQCTDQSISAEGQCIMACRSRFSSSENLEDECVQHCQDLGSDHWDQCDQLNRICEEEQSPPIFTPEPSNPQNNSSICQTPEFWCQINITVPVGTACYCNLPYFSNGVTIPE